MHGRVQRAGVGSAAGRAKEPWVAAREAAFRLPGLVDQACHAGAVGLGAVQGEVGAAAEYPLTLAQGDRMHHEHVLVDQPEARECLRGPDASWHPDVAAGLVLGGVAPLAQVVVVSHHEQLGVVPRDLLLWRSEERARWKE